MSKIINIERHPILKEAVEVCHAIEKCGASDELTQAVIKASTLCNSIDDLLDQLDTKGGRVGAEVINFLAEEHFHRRNWDEAITYWHSKYDCPKCNKTSEQLMDINKLPGIIGQQCMYCGEVFMLAYPDTIVVEPKVYPLASQKHL